MSETISINKDFLSSLKKKRVANPPEMWIRANAVFAPVVSASLFVKAQEIILERSKRYSNEDLLRHLRELLEREGRLSGLLIDEAGKEWHLALSIDIGLAA